MSDTSGSSGFNDMESISFGDDQDYFTPPLFWRDSVTGVNIRMDEEIEEEEDKDCSYKDSVNETIHKDLITIRRSKSTLSLK